MTVPEIAALLKRYAAARGGSFRQLDFLTWAAHHGLSRRVPCELIDQAFHEALDAIELIEGSPHPLWRQREARAA